MLDVDDIKTAVEDAVRNSKGHTRNPVVYNDETDIDGVCEYDDGDGRHCIVGQVLIDLELPSPPESQNRTDFRFLKYYYHEGYLAVDAFELLCTIQQKFDTRTTAKRIPTWRHALKVCKSEGLL